MRDLGLSRGVSARRDEWAEGQRSSWLDAPPGSRAADPEVKEFIMRWMTEEVIETLSRCEPVAGDCGMSRAQLAIAWVLDREACPQRLAG